ncbi:MAG: hypothetical protein HY646_00215 [Acidobacteria bacterium]|nr:hypothetical protein [Acidobacteriota bacterium]
MRHITLLITVLLALNPTGCEPSPMVVSLHPLYDDATLAAEPALAGSWLNQDDETWTFEKSGDNNTYKLIITEDDQVTGEFEAGLVQLAGFLYLDLSSMDSGITGVPGHAFFKVTNDNVKLCLAELNYKWMKVKAAEDNLQRLNTQSRTVLTATTIDLQYFFRRHSLDPEAFLVDAADGEPCLTRIQEQ